MISRVSLCFVMLTVVTLDGGIICGGEAKPEHQQAINSLGMTQDTYQTLLRYYEKKRSKSWFGLAYDKLNSFAAYSSEIKSSIDSSMYEFTNALKWLRSSSSSLADNQYMELFQMFQGHMGKDQLPTGGKQASYEHQGGQEKENNENNDDNEQNEPNIKRIKTPVFIIVFLLVIIVSVGVTLFFLKRQNHTIQSRLPQKKTKTKIRGGKKYRRNRRSDQS